MNGKGFHGSSEDNIARLKERIKSHEEQAMNAALNAYTERFHEDKIRAVVKKMVLEAVKEFALIVAIAATAIGSFWHFRHIFVH
jgi:hypothetical protein